MDWGTLISKIGQKNNILWILESNLVQTKQPQELNNHKSPTFGLVIDLIHPQPTHALRIGHDIHVSGSGFHFETDKWISHV